MTYLSACLGLELGLCMALLFPTSRERLIAGRLRNEKATEQDDWYNADVWNHRKVGNTRREVLKHMFYRNFFRVSFNFEIV